MPTFQKKKNKRKQKRKQSFPLEIASVPTTGRYGAENMTRTSSSSSTPRYLYVRMFGENKRPY